MNATVRTRCCSFLFGFWFATAVYAGGGHERVTLVYDEQQISDPERAALYDAILASTPIDKWRTVKITTPQKVVTVLNDYYDYWYDPQSNDITQSYLKITTQMLSERIRQANPGKVDAAGGIASGTTLLIPPLPVRGRTAAAPKGQGRLFDTNTVSYRKVSSLSGELGQFIQQQPASPLRFDALLAYHTATTTGIQVDREMLERALRDPSRHIRLPTGSVLMKSSSEEVKLTLPGVLTGAAGLGPSLTSPHLADAEAAWAKDRQRVKDIVKQGNVEPFWVVDWWDTPTTGHGARVLSVVYQVLTNLGLYDDLHDYVRTFDLNPRNNAEELSKTLDTYEKRYTERYKSMRPEIAKQTFAEARAWLKSSPQASVGSEEELTTVVNEFVLQAVLVRFVGQEANVVNMSWLVSGAQFQLFHSAFIGRSPTFAVVAAGNSHTAIADDSYPQSRAATDAKFVNVTYSADNERVGGAYSTHGGVPVHVAARGRGFEFGAIHADDGGSSYASPYVATYAWLKVVFDQRAAESLRSDLALAVTPAHAYLDQVVSGGLFAPELLFLPDGLMPHIIVRGQSRPLARVVVNYLDDAGLAQEWQINVGRSILGGKIAVFADSLGYWVWRRASDRDHVVVVNTVSSIEITLVDGERVIYTPQRFIEEVNDICF